MSQRRTASAPHVQGRYIGHRGDALVDYDDVDTRRYASSTSGSTCTHGPALPRNVAVAEAGNSREESSYDLSEHDLEGPSPHGTYYTTRDPRTGSSYPRPVPYSRGGSFSRVSGHVRDDHSSRNEFHRSSPFLDHGSPRGSYSGNFSQPGRYATSYQNRRTYSASHGGRNLRQTYPSDHYDEAGNYVGPPDLNTHSENLVSFPRLPESNSSSPELDHETLEFQRQTSTPGTSKRSFSEQFVDGVRNLLISDSNEPEIPPQPARTGVYLFCRHYLIEECACITPLEDGELGDYCQVCWEGRCSGPRPPGSVLRRSLW
ncbi:uncharacterized protein FTOL_10336 [Fusarium torulosum]|uniref:Uncharacterized protein n=1 Tax=Fusarium torulosum TaxID=33205 RepID=A0AAE8MG29_9HYPO|nr:uncharacterized protein FTOL_10336 [Fusarium torulosum]